MHVSITALDDKQISFAKILLDVRSHGCKLHLHVISKSHFSMEL